MCCPWIFLHLLQNLFHNRIRQDALYLGVLHGLFVDFFLVGARLDFVHALKSFAELGVDFRTVLAFSVEGSSLLTNSIDKMRELKST